MTNEQPMSADELRGQLTAAKGRGYFDELGRGLTVTRPAADDHPFLKWLDTVDLGDTSIYPARCWETGYVKLDRLKASGCPADVVHLVETYDPIQEAVVAIEFASGDLIEPHIVKLAFDRDVH